ncbi:MAG: homoserine kinase [Deltaproteobacteria bacterium]|nr:homoserine kinase [Deltaproteobacteria bacterium]
MGLFTRLTDDEMSAVAESFCLGDVRSFSGIAAGTVNSNYRLETSQGVFFIRVNEGKSEEDVLYETELVEYLVERGVPTPRALPTRDGRRFLDLGFGLTTAFPWREGGHVATRDLAVPDVYRIGRLLGKIHQASASFPRRRESLYGFLQIVDRWRGFAGSEDPELRDAISWVADEIDWLNDRAAHRATLPRGVIHGDLFPDNVLFHEQGAITLLDFEQASDGTFIYDLAVCLVSWCYVDVFIPERVRALREGYEEARPLSPEERESIYVEARAAAMRFTVTRITDVYLNIDATPYVKRHKDFRRYLGRLRELRKLEARGMARILGLP